MRKRPACHSRLRRFSLLGSTFVLLVLGACREQPGEVGIPISAARAWSAQGEHELLNPIPSPPSDRLECFPKEYAFHARADEPDVNCQAPVDYGRLAYEATERAQRRFRDLVCPTNLGCPQKNMVFRREAVSCAGTTAAVDIDFSFRCVKFGQEVEGEPELESARLTPGAVFPPNAPPLPQPDESIRSTTEDQGNRRCPETPLFRVAVLGHVPSCASVVTYDPFRRRAAELKASYWASASCEPGCTKQPIVDIWSRWWCADAPAPLVHVDEQFSIPCFRRP